MRRTFAALTALLGSDEDMATMCTRLLRVRVRVRVRARARVRVTCMPLEHEIDCT